MGCVMRSTPVPWVTEDLLCVCHFTSSNQTLTSLIAVEFGVVGAIGALYPTSGFSAAYTLAHEIGNTNIE